MSWAANLEAVGVSAAPAASQTLTLATSPAVGDILVVVYGSYINLAAISSATISDNKGGNTWVQDVFATDSEPNRAIVIWHTTIVNGGSSFVITVTPSASGYNTIMCLRYANPGGTVTAESHNSSFSWPTAGTAATAGALTIASGPDLVVSGTLYDFATSATAGGSATMEVNPLTQEAGAAQDQLNVMSGLTPTMTLPSTQWIMGAVAFKYTASAPAANPAALLAANL